VERHRELRLRFQNGDGATCEIAAEGPLAELIQHEMDHLDGVLAVDRAIDAVSLCTRDEWQRRYRDVETMVER
jgi:peptide deformylase